MNTTDKSLARDHHPAAIAARLLREPKPQYVSDAVLGGIDGCVTTFAVVSGALGAGFSSSVAVVLGFSNLIADGFSMAISNYEATTAQREHTDSVRREEEKHIDEIPHGEREEIRQIFQQKGFAGDTLATIVKTITDDRRLWVETMLSEEHGLQTIKLNPFGSSATTFGAFVLVGTVPLLPFLNASMAMQQQYFFSAVLAGMMFFLIGSLKSLSFGKPIFRAGIKTLLTGGAAASLAFCTGYLLRRVFDL